MRLTGKTIVITAAAQGMGRASALACAREGATVIASDINAEHLATLKAENPSIETHVVDVRDAAAVKAFAAKIPAPDGLFNCAGFVHNGSILECEEADWDFSMDINVRSMYRLTRALLPRMLARAKEQGSAPAILNMASMCSSIKGFPNRFVYGLTKAANLALVNGLAQLTRGTQVTVNAVLPGPTASEGVSEFVGTLAGQAQQTPEQFEKEFFRSVRPTSLLQRFATVDEVANLVTYVCSPRASATNGAALRVDGGVLRATV